MKIFVNMAGLNISPDDIVRVLQEDPKLQKDFPNVLTILRIGTDMIDAMVRTVKLEQKDISELHRFLDWLDVPERAKIYNKDPRKAVADFYSLDFEKIKEESVRLDKDVTIILEALADDTSEG